MAPLRHLRGAALLAALLLVVLPQALLPLRPSGSGPGLAAAGLEDAQAPQPAAPTEDGVAGIWAQAVEAIRPLKEEIDSGHIVPKFGEKAEAIVRKSGATLERAVDGLLHSLFLRQLALLRQQTAQKFVGAGARGGGNSRPLETMTQADQLFVAQAEELKRPGSTWSYEQERYALRSTLQGHYQRAAALLEEKAMAAQSQQATIEVIGRLQAQMENLQQKVQHLRAGSPWFLSSSYRIPGTPLSVIGRYQQGRANIEINLSPDRDPANAQAGFVEGYGPANLGVGLNIGI